MLTDSSPRSSLRIHWSNYGESIEMALAAQSIRLQELKPGIPAVVQEIVGSNDEVARLAELGLHNGAMISIVRKGSPCIVQVNRSRMCVRPSALLNVLVTPVSR